METLELRQIENMIEFTNSLENEVQVNLMDSLKFLEGFGEIFDREKADLPYHINLIDELHADENAHSRIFAKLLRYKANDKYPFLEKFLNDICNFNVTIENPTVKNVDSCGRIDIPIFDKKYVVVIENKVTDKAPDQNNQKGGQLARYIETINNTYNRKLEDIFVVYTPKYTREPPNECWTNKDDFSYKDDFKLRFRSLSYRDSIYPWFKNDILPIIDDKDIYLRSAVEQYIDHLEGMFWLRTIDKKMNMKLQEFIKGKLEINEVEPEIALKIVSEKRQEMANVLAQLDLLQEEIQTEIDVKYFSETYNKLKELDYIVVRKIDSYPDYLPKSVGVKLANKLTIWLGKDDGIESELFCQVNSNDNDKKLPLKVKQKFEEIFRDENIGTDKNGFQIWAYIENYDNALIYLKEFCEKMSEI